MVKIGDMNLNLDKIVEETGYSEEFLRNEIIERHNSVGGNIIDAINYICEMARSNSLKKEGDI